MSIFLPLLIVIICMTISSSKNKSKKTQNKDPLAMEKEASNPAGKSFRKEAKRGMGNTLEASEASKASNENEPVQITFDDVLSYDEFERDGSITMPPMEPHEHEGKPMPCPAEERRKPRPRPSQMADAEQRKAERKTKGTKGLQLDFGGNSMVQSVVMAEILKRPEYKNGRRVIR